MKHITKILTALLLVPLAGLHAAGPLSPRPHPVTNPESTLMLSGAWVPDDSQQIDFAMLPRVASEHAVVSDVRAKGVAPVGIDKKNGGVNQHNYLVHHNGKFWVMWSDGPGVEDRVGQRVKFATSADGLKWSSPQWLTPVPPASGPDSPYYNTRDPKGFRYISRGFWKRDGELLALASLDEAAGFFGKSLELHAFRLKADESWEDAGVVFKDAINNFPPLKLRTGDWMMSRRAHDYKQTGVHFLVGGVKGLDQWSSFSVLGSSSKLKAEEPDWWILPDQNLMAVFRDNGRSGFVHRSFSTDDGRTWSPPVKSNFPDATSKISGLRLSDGRYVLVSNPQPKKRDPLTLSISDDGMVFTKMLYLVGDRHIDYPHVIEHDGHLYIAFAGGKQSVEVLKVKLADMNAVKMPITPLIAPLKPSTNAVSTHDGLLLDVVVPPAQGERFQHAVFSCWLPDAKKPVKAVIIHQHGCTNAAPDNHPPVTGDWHWRALARKHDCALLVPMYRVAGDCANWNDPDSGSERALFAALADFAQRSGRAELKDAPWILWGHSGGSSWSAQMMVRHPKRVLAASFRGGCHKQFGVPEFRAKFGPIARELPLLFVWGKRESVPTSSHFVSWEPMNTMYRELRALGGKVCRVTDPRSEHGCDDSRLMSIPFFDAVLSGETSTGSLVDIATLDVRAFNTTNQSDPTLTWLPNEHMATLWREFSTNGTLHPKHPQLQAPVLAATRQTNGSIRLTWRVEPALDGGLRAMRLHRDGTLWKELALKPEAFLATSRDSAPEGLRDSGITDESNEPHTYKLTFLDTVGNESPPSADARVP